MTVKLGIIRADVETSTVGHVRLLTRTIAQLPGYSCLLLSSYKHVLGLCVQAMAWKHSIVASNECMVIWVRHSGVVAALKSYRSASRDILTAVHVCLWHVFARSRVHNKGIVVCTIPFLCSAQK